MSEPTLADLINSLSEDEQKAVREFIYHVKSKPPMSFAAAVDEFIVQHPDLLDRLAR